MLNKKKLFSGEMDIYIEKNHVIGDVEILYSLIGKSISYSIAKKNYKDGRFLIDYIPNQSNESQSVFQGMDIEITEEKRSFSTEGVETRIIVKELATDSLVLIISNLDK